MHRYMLLIKASPEAESTFPPPPSVFEAMTTFNEQLNAAGVLLGGEGFAPTSSDAYRITYGPSGVEHVTPGSFDVERETHVCGWWILRTRDAEEALGWARKIPFQKGEVVMRRIAEMEDFGESMGEELVEREEDGGRRYKEGGGREVDVVFGQHIKVHTGGMDWK